MPVDPETLGGEVGGPSGSCNFIVAPGPSMTVITQVWGTGTGGEMPHSHQPVFAHTHVSQCFVQRVHTCARCLLLSEPCKVDRHRQWSVSHMMLMYMIVQCHKCTLVRVLYITCAGRRVEYTLPKMELEISELTLHTIL